MEEQQGPPVNGVSIPTPSLQKSLWVRNLSLSEANSLLQKHHYLGAVRTASLCFGHDEGCTVWGTLRSRGLDAALRSKGFSAVELIRMVGVSDHAWAMSSLLSVSSRLLFKQSDFGVLVTYADRQQGHDGHTYLAANWTQIQDAQPDGFNWFLDGKLVSRKRFFGEFGSSAWDVVKQAYGDRIQRQPDVPKARFLRVRHQNELSDVLQTCLKKKTWGAARLKQYTNPT